MPKRLKCETAILCEHVVAGANRKHTLVNVFGGDVMVEKFPAALTLGVYLLMAAGTPKQMKIEIRLGNESVGELNAAFERPNDTRPSTLTIPLITLEVQRDTTFSVVASAEGYARTVLMSKRIYQGTITS